VIVPTSCLYAKHPTKQRIGECKHVATVHVYSNVDSYFFSRSKVIRPVRHGRSVFEQKDGEKWNRSFSKAPQKLATTHMIVCTLNSKRLIVAGSTVSNCYSNQWRALSRPVDRAVALEKRRFHVKSRSLPIYWKT
jgi:hypothetical protein